MDHSLQQEQTVIGKLMNSTGGQTLATVDLDNCDKEPIHVPGHVQPHGVLLAFDGECRLTHASRNAPRLLPSLPSFGQRFSDAPFEGSAEIEDSVARVLRDAAAGEDPAPLAIELVLGGTVVDVVTHAHGGRVIVEFEPREPGSEDLATFALMAYRSMGRLRSRRDIESILAEAVATVRQLTAFDRVLAYRFHADDSGEIVAEAKAEPLASYLGRRFPAADIPVQARRLYTINTLRLIASVDDAQVPIDTDPALDPLLHPLQAAPLDLSHSILRSVSPIHIEYLRNIDVAASMSVSIVVGGRLWGLIACHHGRAHRVPYAVRMACDVLSHIVSASVQVAIEKAGARRRSAAADVCSQLAEVALQSQDVLLGLSALQPTLRQILPCDEILVAHGNNQAHPGSLPTAAAAQLVRWLSEQNDDLIALHELSRLPESLRDAIAPMRGLLALRFDRVNGGWIVLLRLEQTETITWSGPPDKVLRTGPLGERLTLSGSLAEWRQSVQGTSRPWDDVDLTIARDVLDQLGRATASRVAELERARAHLLAVLGHDLRDPLQSISAAARLLEMGRGQATMGQRITASAGRMSRLISQVLDMSRLHGGLGLGIDLRRADLAALIRGIVEEALLTYPNLSVTAHLPPALDADIDGDRMAQVVVNLLANARQHGLIGEPIEVRLEAEAPWARFTVLNVAGPIDDALVPRLFDPMKPSSVGNTRNPEGLGLGLYIASEVIRGHKGTIGYRHDGERVAFTVSVPLSPALASSV